MENWKIDFLGFMSNLETENDIDDRLRYICNYFGKAPRSLSWSLKPPMVPKPITGGGKTAI